MNKLGVFWDICIKWGTDRKSITGNKVGIATKGDATTSLDEMMFVNAPNVGLLRNEAVGDCAHGTGQHVSECVKGKKLVNRGP
jgi:hypothetical protein